ncbi:MULTISPECIES: hypothetical protein [unclassified Clostridium]|uniref:hypothetical protein n=1 Tax=unclassified Clostridium TaxID=2614128 RepID=UPI000E4F8F3A|nr:MULTISPECIES: hypothetical protein [unclassified Clostridium]RHS85951.1 hypothetical protein DW922_11150 [Clostridium sp. AM42-4]RHV87079.1 hypothetical protein DXA97_10935 [Clostridium sp. OF09-36]HBM46689.1 hypothetical protein [Lachnoclostridium sp.]
MQPGFPIADKLQKMVVLLMRTDRFIITLAAAVFAGWLFAVLLCNGVFYKDIVNYEVLYGEMADYWSRVSLRGRADRVFLLVARFLEMAAVFAVTRCRFRKTGSLLLGILTGFYIGSNLSLFVWGRGIMGGVLFLVAGFPQDLAYLSCLFLLLFAGGSERPVQKDRLICITLFLLAAGIWLELYVNPLLLKCL